jgi:O-antigen/teichoic acid export membrane protein
MKIDQIMVGEIIGNKGLGIFSAAVRLSEITYFIPVVICSSLFPSIIKTHARNIQEYKYKLQQLYDLLVGISISLVIFISLFSKYIVVMIYGNEFIAASSVLVVHIWTCLFVYVGFASGQQLVVENLIPLGLYRTIMGVVINVILNFIFIPMWGIIGGALSTLFTQIFVSWVSLCFYKKTRDMFWMILNSFNPMRLIKVYILRPS